MRALTSRLAAGTARPAADGRGSPRGALEKIGPACRRRRRRCRKRRRTGRRWPLGYCRRRRSWEGRRRRRHGGWHGGWWHGRRALVDALQRRVHPPPSCWRGGRRPRVPLLGAARRRRRRGRAVARWRSIPAARCAAAAATDAAAASSADPTGVAQLLSNALGPHAAHGLPLCLGTPLTPPLPAPPSPPPTPLLNRPSVCEAIELKDRCECEGVLHQLEWRPRPPVGQHKRQGEAHEAGEACVHRPRETATQHCGQQRAQARSIAAQRRRD